MAYLHRDGAVYRDEGFQALSKIEVRANGQRILATLNVVDNPNIVACDELGLFKMLFPAWACAMVIPWCLASRATRIDGGTVSQNCR